MCITYSFRSLLSRRVRTLESSSILDLTVISVLVFRRHRPIRIAYGGSLPDRRLPVGYRKATAKSCRHNIQSPCAPALRAPMANMPFNYELQIAYFANCLRQLPEGYSKLDTNRLTLVHFAVHALDLLGAWEAAELQAKYGLNPASIIDWIYSLQVPATKDYENQAGFKGGSFLGGCCSDPSSLPWTFNHGHIAMTYTAISTLRTLGDDWSRLDTAGIINAMKALQLEDGSFACIAVGSEHDMRFLYCACCISHMLNDWRGINVEKAVQYISACRSFDGAIALLPGQEGHGGSTFCAIGSLTLMNKLAAVVDDKWRSDLIRWCVHRQVGGMQGRPNKLEDTCYSYWIGGTLRLLGEDQFLDHNALRAYVMRCQTRMGGFGKDVGAFPDILHSFYSMSYLSISQTHADDDSIQLKPLNCTLGICEDRADLFQPLYP
jgi:geranylgeranyl transferase type-1 subunit beta